MIKIASFFGKKLPLKGLTLNLGSFFSERSSSGIN
jgi:hypothetical protein